MRVLWVCGEVPHHTGWGGPIRQAHLLDALAAQATVDLVTCGVVDDPAVRAGCGQVTELAAATIRPESSLVRRIRCVLPSPPVEVRRWAVPRQGLRAAIDTAIGSAAVYDVVVLVHNELAPLLPAGRTATPRYVLDLHHLLSVRHGHAAARAAGRQRAYHRIEARRARRFERDLMGRADRVLVCSDDDAAALPGGAAVVVPNGVDVEGLVPTPLPPARRLVFTGHLGYPPNIDAVEWMVTQILPVVRQRVPDVELEIVGRAPHARVHRLVTDAGDHVRLSPDVPAIAPHLARARVALVPIREGSGTRLKALEALAAGRPVVGTTIGLEGLGIRDGVDALVADDTDAFAAAIVRLLDDDHLAARLAAAGRDRAQALSWALAGQRFVEAVCG